MTCNGVFCRAHETHLDCVEDSINEHCNDALAGKWQRGLDERNLAPTLHYERCIMGGGKAARIIAHAVCKEKVDLSCRKIQSLSW